MRSYHKPLLSKAEYRKKLYKSSLLAAGLIAFSLALGVVGYCIFAQLGFVDALLNASMILTGMGPVNDLKTDGAKIFASLYAIYSGVAFLTILAVLFAPIFHRFLHKFHLDISDEEQSKEDNEPEHMVKKKQKM
jgi:hypothetical protein